MKKILCCILVVMVLMTTFVIGANATSLDNSTNLEKELAEKFFDYCGGNDVDWDNPYLSTIDPRVRILEYTQADDIVFFSAVPRWIDPLCLEVTKVYGKWCVYCPMKNYPSEFGLYVKIGEDIYTIEDAWEKELVTDLTPVEGFSELITVTRIDATDPTTDKPTEPVVTEPQPTTPVLTTPTVETSENKKLKNPIKVTAQTKTVKAKKLKSKKQTVRALTITNAQGKVTATIVKNGTSKKILKKIKINKKGVITLKKGKYNKTTYKIKVKITANGNASYKPSTKTKTVKIKVK
ncbi:MAG: hypothetical protein J1E96_04135 [Ruminococcus sp.]|nr:hypothetical protein [Ruminococcus sp.]